MLGAGAIVALTMASTLARAEMPPANVIPQAKAEEIALKVSTGTIKESDLELENKVWIYSIEIEGKDRKVHEVNIDALTGKIVENKVETPTMEAQEAKEDADAKK